MPWWMAGKLGQRFNTTAAATGLGSPKPPQNTLPTLSCGSHQRYCCQPHPRLMQQQPPQPQDLIQAPLLPSLVAPECPASMPAKSMHHCSNALLANIFSNVTANEPTTNMAEPAAPTTMPKVPPGFAPLQLPPPPVPVPKVPIPTEVTLAPTSAATPTPVPRVHTPPAPASNSKSTCAQHMGDTGQQ